LEHPDSNSRKLGLIVLQKQPIIVSSTPILTSDNEGPVHGALVFARNFDSIFTNYLSEKADMKISSSVVGSSFSPPSSATMINVGNNKFSSWIVTNKNTITCFALLRDVDNKPAVILQFTQPRKLFKQAQNSIMFYLFYFGISGVVFFFIVRTIFQRTIFARLNSTINGMSLIRKKQDLSIRIQESGDDEITQLEKSFNHMMKSLEEAQNVIKYQAEHDPLTGLANREAFFNHLEKIIEQSQKNHSQFAVLFIDLDRFKYINDTMGHPMGDLLLLKVAERLRHCLNEGDFLSRLGGDEFCVITHNTSDSNQIEQLAQIIKESIERPFDLKGSQVAISTSIGISLFPEHGTDSESLLQYSDTAMLDVKETGKNNYRWYSESFEAIRTKKMLMEQLLKNAIENEEFALHYQPKWDLANHKMAGVEVLLRWTNSKLGAVSPHEFIPIAESSGMIIDIGEWIIRSACKQFVAWQTQFPDMALNVAINISGVQLLHSDFVERIRDIFVEEKVSPCHFELEVTESFAIEKFEDVVGILVELRRLGFMIAIDDFGAGYSSMKYLCQLPIQCMKIDKSLIEQLEDNVRNQVVVSKLIEMAHQLQLFVVAEGVELPEQFRLLQTYGCDQIQGYLISKPVPAARLIELEYFS
jgi:diguanylate cyclase (GGDEF)-like protein